MRERRNSLASFQNLKIKKKVSQDKHTSFIFKMFAADEDS